MLRNLLLVSLGGFLGSAGRYLVSSYFSRLFSAAFPIGTFAVNVLGCLIIGLVIGLSQKHRAFTPELGIFLTTGFCGGFTTFSAFSVESLGLIQSGDYLNLALYTCASISLGILAVFCGIAMSKVM
jgi:fluoride exporter